MVLIVRDSLGTTVTVPQRVLVFGSPDVNSDVRVDIFDASLIVSSYNSPKGDPNYLSLYDFNWDGKIDIVDVAYLVFYYDANGWP